MWFVVTGLVALSISRARYCEARARGVDAVHISYSVVTTRYTQPVNLFRVLIGFSCLIGSVHRSPKHLALNTKP